MKRQPSVRPEPPRTTIPGRLSLDNPLSAPLVDQPIERARAVRRVSKRTVPNPRNRWARVAGWTRNIGILLLLFCAYQIWGTGFAQARSQARLKRSFSQAVAAPATSAQPAPASTTPSPSEQLLARPEGAAVALIKAPTIDLAQAVVEGTSASDLRQGPGLYHSSPMPGQSGNVAVAGHRTTYGAPFRRLDDLSVGDPILVTTKTGEFRYTVSEQPRVVSPDDNQVLADHGDNRLTLTTCNPLYQASERLIVVARPVEPPPTAPQPGPAAATTPAPLPAQAGEASVALNGDASAWIPSVLWAGLFALVWLGFDRLRRQTPVLAMVIAVPFGLATLLFLFGSLSRLLPANL